MGFANEVSKLFNNKYFLYFMVFLASTNILGYLVTNKVNALVFFLLTSVLTYQFTKNMSIVLLVALIATNFLMANKKVYEGLENSNALNKVTDTDPEIANAVQAVKDSSTNKEVYEKLNNPIKTVETALNDNVVDINNAELNKKTSDNNAPQGAGEKISSKKGKTEEHFGPRLDYAATIDESYQHLDNLLGSDSIQKLTADTQKLMQQQQNLFNTMNQMVPVLEGAQNMLQNFNFDNLTDSLTSIGGLKKAPIAGLKNPKTQ
jgi:hypothetical protein